MAAQPDYLDFLDNLFGGLSSTDFLDNLAKSGTTDGATAAPASAQAPSAGSGKSVRVSFDGTTSTMMPYEQFDALRAQQGWVDPSTLNLNDFERYSTTALEGSGAEGGNPVTTEMMRLKEGSSGGFAPGITPLTWFDSTAPISAGGASRENSDVTYQTGSGYQSGAVGKFSGNDKLTPSYTFDTEGNVIGLNFASPHRTGFASNLRNMAPALTFMAAPFLGGVTGALGSTINSAVPALGAAGAKVAAGSLVGGGLAALGGGNVGTGLLTGGVGGAISAYNPASSLFGVTDKATQAFINSGIGTASKFGINAAARGKG